MGTVESGARARMAPVVASLWLHVAVVAVAALIVPRANVRVTSTIPVDLWVRLPVEFRLK